MTELVFNGMELASLCEIWFNEILVHSDHWFVDRMIVQQSFETVTIDGETQSDFNQIIHSSFVNRSVCMHETL